MKHAISLVLTLTLALGLLSACSNNTPAASSTPLIQADDIQQPSENTAGTSTINKPQKDVVSSRDTLRVAFKSEVQGVDPYTQGVTGTTVAGLIFDSLTERVADGSIAPNLAESWEVVDDTTWRFKLREGNNFTNGEVCNAQTFVSTWDILKQDDITWPNKGDMAAIIDSIEAVGDYEILIHTKMPYSMLPLRMSLLRPIAPEDYANRGEEGLLNSPVGNGSYMLESYERGGTTKLTANPDHIDGAAPIKNLEFTVITDPSSRVAALEAGDVDLINGIPFNELNRLSQNPNLVVAARPTTFTLFLQFSQYANPALQDVRVRKALSMALDMDSIVDDVLDGCGGKINTPIFNPSYTGYDPDVKRLPYDPDGAKALLADAGYGSGLTLTLSFTPGSHAGVADAAQVMKQMWAEIGVTVELQEVESGLLQQQYLAKETSDMVINALGGTQGTGTVVANMAFCPDQRFSVYNDPAFAELRDKAEAELDETKRNELLHDLQQYSVDNAIGVGLWQIYEGWAWDKDLQGFDPYTTTLMLNVRNCWFQ